MPCCERFRAFLLHPVIQTEQSIHICVQREIIRCPRRIPYCLDNAPMESFFGHFKDEVDATTRNTVQELRRKVEDYMDYYNSARY
ncbi:IS3 family transposase [Fictibacillus iocasae]|uniref:IS3 family transposase n=1 Tax=Fictibacillus iocasae TaxID=2715437 RepID=A0ABW2NUM4_9BACL